MPQDRVRFGFLDRVTIRGASYRPVAKVGSKHVLQLITDGKAPGEHHATFSDEEIFALFDERQIRVDEFFYSRAGQLLKARGDDSDLTGLSEDDLRTVAWKVQWCVGFNQAHAGLTDRKRPARTPAGLARFIEDNKVDLHDWYKEEFKVPRPLGRQFVGQKPKDFDYPSPSTLRDWLERYEAHDEKQRAFEPLYANCGRRDQIDSRALAIVEENVRFYASRALPTYRQVYARVECAIDLANEGIGPDAQISVSERAVRRRIHALSPVFKDAGRLGIERARRKYTPIGDGLTSLDGLTPLSRMERVEVDDWEMDLFTVLMVKDVWDTLSDEARGRVNRLRGEKVVVRCTVTVAIDVATKCIVGLSVTPFAPSAAGSKTALRGVVADKSQIAKWAGAVGSWHMHARPEEVATDGGPAFRGDFHEALVQMGIEHRHPAKNPTFRGTIEAFFRNFKVLCAAFTGQAFSNVVKKADYPAESMASLFVEDLQKHIVRYVVDTYHHEPHAGLGEQRPVEAWRLADNDLSPPPDHTKKALAFGLPVTGRTIDAAGIVYLHIQYVHARMGQLHGLVGRGRLTIVVDPHDLGHILVKVPRVHKPSFSGGGDYLTFTQEAMRGVTLAEHIVSNERLLHLARLEEKAGRPFRVGSHRALLKDAEAIRVKAGLPSDELSANRIQQFTDEIERAGKQVMASRVVPAGPPSDTLGEGSVPPGRSIGSKAGTAPPDAQGDDRTLPRPKKPIKSINMYGED